VRDGGREREGGREGGREEGRERERERSHESGIKSRREQTVPKYQRPRNKRRRPDVLARCLSLFLSLSLSLSLAPCPSLSSPPGLFVFSRRARTDVPETDVFSTLSGIYVDQSWTESAATRVLTKRGRERQRGEE